MVAPHHKTHNMPKQRQSSEESQINKRTRILCYYIYQCSKFFFNNSTEPKNLKQMLNIFFNCNCYFFLLQILLWFVFFSLLKMCLFDFVHMLFPGISCISIPVAIIFVFFQWTPMNLNYRHRHRLYHGCCCSAWTLILFETHLSIIRSHLLEKLQTNEMKKKIFQMHNQVRHQAEKEHDIKAL